MSGPRGAEISPDPGSNVTQETFLAFIEELDNADQMVAEAVGNRKDVYKRAEGAGLNKPALIEARRVAQQSGERRDRHHRDVRQYMLWYGKPIGYQGDLLAPDGPATRSRSSNGETVSEHQANQIEAEGRNAGEAGRNRSENPWSPGTFTAERWDAGWLEGQAAIAATMAPPETARRRGRPPGSRNRPKP
jgi:hypothetical protein